MLTRLTLFFSYNRFRKEILFVILLKLVGLGLLWWVCFSHPVVVDRVTHLVGG